jgi:Uma2 family endonuclease
MPAFILEKYTYDDYKLWEGDWELIDGIPQAMAPSPVGIHQFLLMKIGTVLNKKLEEINCNNCFVLGEIDYIVSDETVLKPDIALVCGKIPAYIKTPPVAIFEIVSPSTKLRDEITKKNIYKKAGVKYYFLVYPDEKKVIFENKEINLIEIDIKCGKINFSVKEIFKGLD